MMRLNSWFMGAFGGLLIGFGTQAVADGDPAQGERVFKRACRMCHDATEDGQNKVGPKLFNLFGTVGGTAPAYSFSDAMKEAKIVWTEQNLIAHTTDPQAFTPGTKMPKPYGLNDQDRKDVVAYLRKIIALGPADGIEEYAKNVEIVFYGQIQNIIGHYCSECSRPRYSAFR